MRAKKKLKKYEEMLTKFINLIRSRSKNSDDYDKKYIKVKFNSVDELPINKTVGIPNMIIVLRAIFLESNKPYPEFFLDKWQKKQTGFYILLAFLLITIALMIAVSIFKKGENIKQNQNTYYHFASKITNL